MENLTKNTELSAEPAHRAGFVSIIGMPNVGKSTLMNALVGERLSIVTSKAQTTRHRIFGIINQPDYQIVYSDTPGLLEPKYALHKSMMAFVESSLQDADLILFVADPYQDEQTHEIMEKINRSHTEVLFLLNKSDQLSPEETEEKLAFWREQLPNRKYLAVSALKKLGTDQVLQIILENLPQHPPYFPKDQITDKPERFFAAEIVREKIFLNYKKEIPYSCEVVIMEFKDREDILFVRAEILVERASQRAILIGHQGEPLKKTGTQARIEMEAFFGKKVYLDTHVSVEADWRNQAQKLRNFGYINS